MANAIFDGTDAVMLSGETAIGKYPVQTVQMMARIIEKAEASVELAPPILNLDSSLSFPDAIGQAAAAVSTAVSPKAIVAFTQSGSTARPDFKAQTAHADYCIYTQRADMSAAVLVLGG